MNCLVQFWMFLTTVLVVVISVLGSDITNNVHFRVCKVIGYKMVYWMVVLGCRTSQHATGQCFCIDCSKLWRMENRQNWCCQICWWGTLATRKVSRFSCRPTTSQAPLGNTRYPEASRWKHHTHVTNGYWWPYSCCRGAGRSNWIFSGAAKSAGDRTWHCSD